MIERDDRSDEEREDDGAIGELEDEAVAEQAEAYAAASDGLDAVEQLRGLITFLVQNLVDRPDEVTIDVEQLGQLVRIDLRVPEDELGKVIGRGGRIAKAMRTALMIAGSQHHLRVSLDIEN